MPLERWKEIEINDIISALNEKIAVDLVWTNSDVANEFPEQTITLDLSSYRFIIIQAVTLVYAPSGTREFSSFIVPIDEQKHAIDICQQYNYYRDVKVYYDGIAFGTGTYFSTYGSYNGTLSNTSLVPWKIYGMK